MIARIAIAIVTGILVAVLIYILGVVCVATGVPILKQFGNALEDFAWLLGFVAAVLAFFGGWSPFRSTP